MTRLPGGRHCASVSLMQSTRRTGLHPLRRLLCRLIAPTQLTMTGECQHPTLGASFGRKSKALRDSIDVSIRQRCTTGKARLHARFATLCTPQLATVLFVLQGQLFPAPLQAPLLKPQGGSTFAEISTPVDATLPIAASPTLVTAAAETTFACQSFSAALENSSQ